MQLDARSDNRIPIPVFVSLGNVKFSCSNDSGLSCDSRSPCVFYFQFLALSLSRQLRACGSITRGYLAVRRAVLETWS